MSLLVHKTSYENAKHNVVPGDTGFPEGVFSSFGYGNFFADGEISLFTVTSTYDWNKPFNEATESLFEFWTLSQNKWKKKENVFIDDFTGPIHDRKALVADFNGDSIPDVFVSNHGYDKPPFPGERNHIVLSQGNGKFLVRHASPEVDFFHGASAVDLDFDGDIDVAAVTGGSGLQTIYTFFNDGSGNFSKHDNNSFSIQLPSTLYYSIEFIDVNNDDLADLLLGGHEDEGAETLLFLNPGNFVFSNVNPIAIPPVPGEDVVLDFLVTNTIEGKDLWILRTSGGDVTSYQSTVLQKFSLPSLSSEIVYNERNGAWTPWIFSDSKNGKRSITSADGKNLFEFDERGEIVGSSVHRLFNPQSGVHLYSASKEEMDIIISNPASGYKYEGIAYQALPTGGTELYRFYNAGKNYHFLTANTSEALSIIKNSLSANYDLVTGINQEAMPGSTGFKYEGRAFRVSDTKTEQHSTPVYRFYNTQRSVHFYSSNLFEVNNLIGLSHGDQFKDNFVAATSAPLINGGMGYQFEGPAWYV